MERNTNIVKVKKNGRSMIQLVSRIGINCSSFNEDEFARFIMEDFNDALKLYHDSMSEENARYTKERKEEYLQRKYKDVVEYAKMHWKTDKKRHAYIDLEMSKAESTYKAPKLRDTLSFFDWNVFPDNVGIPSYGILDADSNLHNMYESLMSNKYFKNANGWVFEFEASKDNSLLCCTRPHISMILNENMSDKFKSESENLGKCIADFYKDTTYFGD